MVAKKSKIFPIIITVLLIVIIIYLFATVKQPYVECSKDTTNQLDIEIKEELKTNLDGNRISKIELTKIIILPEKYLSNNKKYLKTIKESLKVSYAYLGKNKVKFTEESNKIIMNIVIDKDETVILNNIEFVDNDDLQIKINSNTKSSDVVTLKISDKYTEGELMTHLKNNGYSCK